MNVVKSIFAIALLCCTIVGVVLGAYIMRPPENGRLSELAQVIQSDDGTIINLRLTEDGYWREKASISKIDPTLIDVLIAYEDQRFWSHGGVDLKAVFRASYNFLKSGRITSGASTLTMQTARLINPALAQRSIPNKIRQMIEAVRLERHWSKEEILEAYFTLAPYGGNIEGVYAASEAWFQKPPKKLTLNEISLLVSLPQSPERRRPDKFPAAAFKAKRLVLTKIKDRLNLDESVFSEVVSEPLPVRLLRPKSIAPHLADRFSKSGEKVGKTSINANWQKQVHRILESEIQKYPEPVQTAAIVVERKTGLVKAYVGSADYAALKRKGANNYLSVSRSPGSTLKPFIYGKALQRNLIQFDHVFEDASFYRSGYVPTNFDNTYSGKVTLKDALLRSLNIPALIALEELGPNSFETELKSLIGHTPKNNKRAGLSLAVGGFYLNAEQLAKLYLTALDPGYAIDLSFGSINTKAFERTDPSLFYEETSKQILHLLIQDLPNGERVAFKTGTSFARHDAWSVQVYDKYVVLAWLGTPDNEATEILTGRMAAFPISNEIGVALGLKSPKFPTLKKEEVLAVNFQKDVCGKLINYPENGTWIRSRNAVFNVVGSNEASWYLNGQKVKPLQRKIRVDRPGVHNLTAKSGSCSQTSEIFVEFN